MTHNSFRVVYLASTVAGDLRADRLTLAQQVLDRMGIATAYFDKATYLTQQSGAVKITVHDVRRHCPQVTVQQRRPTSWSGRLPGANRDPRNLHRRSEHTKTGSQGGGIKVNSNGYSEVVYEDAPGHTVWSLPPFC